MLDGKSLQALVAISEFRSFEKAAAHLGITQSALSQRVRLLETRIGKPLVVRSPQTRMTKAGERLICFEQQRAGLEGEALTAVGAKDSQKWASVALGVNADSLATWFKSSLSVLQRGSRAVVELMVCDQTETIDLLRAGSVSACVSSWPHPIQGCSRSPLGRMSYRCVASRDALARSGETKLTLKLGHVLPAVVFGRHDDILADYIKLRIGLDRHEYPAHIVPSTADLLAFVEAGFGYSLLPALQIAKQLKSGHLVDITPKCHYEVKLFWHQWKISTELVESIAAAVRTVAETQLGVDR